MKTEIRNGQRPPQTPENSITTTNNFSPKPSNNQFFEDLLKLRARYRLRYSYASLPPEDRISPPQESQGPIKPKVSTIIFNEKTERHLEKVKTCQKEFDLQVGYQREISAYDPVLDRVNFELAATSEEVQAVRADMGKELETALRERYHTPLSIIKYILDENGVAYSEDDTKEPVDVKFQRGALHRIKDLHSPEAEREQQTVKAGILAKRKLAEPNIPLHSKIIIVSPPGVIEGTVYKDNFVDIFEVDKDPVTGKRVIWMFRYASSLSSEEYKKVLTNLQPDFFTGKTGAFDVQCLDPIFIDSRVDGRSVRELFNKEFRFQKEVTGEADFQEILAKSLSIRQNYIDVVCGKIFNPREIAIAFNAVLNKADAIRREIISRGKGILSSLRNFGISIVNNFKSVKEEAAWRGRQAVEMMMGGCGPSGGYSIGESSSSTGGIISSIKGVISSVASKISGLFSKDKDYCIHCGACGEEIRRVVRKGEKCPKCQAVRQC